MTELTLGCTDGEMVSLSAQTSTKRPSFGKISKVGAGGVGLHGTEISWRDACTAQGIVDCKAGLLTLGLRGHDVVGITAAAAGQQPALG